MKCENSWAHHQEKRLQRKRGKTTANISRFQSCRLSAGRLVAKERKAGVPLLAVSKINLKGPTKIKRNRTQKRFSLLTGLPNSNSPSIFVFFVYLSTRRNRRNETWQGFMTCNPSSRLRGDVTRNRRKEF